MKNQDKAQYKEIGELVQRTCSLEMRLERMEAMMRLGGPVMDISNMVSLSKCLDTLKWSVQILHVIILDSLDLRQGCGTIL